MQTYNKLSSTSPSIINEEADSNDSIVINYDDGTNEAVKRKKPSWYLDKHKGQQHENPTEIEFAHSILTLWSIFQMFIGLAPAFKPSLFEKMIPVTGKIHILSVIDLCITSCCLVANVIYWCLAKKKNIGWIQSCWVLFAFLSCVPYLTVIIIDVHRIIYCKTGQGKWLANKLYSPKEKFRELASFIRVVLPIWACVLFFGNNPYEGSYTDDYIREFSEKVWRRQCVADKEGYAPKNPPEACNTGKSWYASRYQGYPKWVEETRKKSFYKYKGAQPLRFTRYDDYWRIEVEQNDKLIDQGVHTSFHYPITYTIDNKQYRIPTHYVTDIPSDYK